MNHGLPDIVESHAGKDGLNVGEREGQLQALYQDSMSLKNLNDGDNFRKPARFSEGLNKNPYQLSRA